MFRRGYGYFSSFFDASTDASGVFLPSGQYRHWTALANNPNWHGATHDAGLRLGGVERESSYKSEQLVAANEEFGKRMVCGRWVESSGLKGRMK